MLPGPYGNSSHKNKIPRLRRRRQKTARLWGGICSCLACAGVLFWVKQFYNVIAEERRWGSKTKEEPDFAYFEQAEWPGIAPGIPSVPRGKEDIHLVFSTDCSHYQNWQSLLLFHSAERVGQPGRLTRIASGCTNQQQADIYDVVKRLPERFEVHFAPDYSIDPYTGERYFFYNKPNGLQHFLKNARPPVDAAVVVLIDPDMVLLRPLTPDITDAQAMMWHTAYNAEFIRQQWGDCVSEGKPVGQFYGLGGTWPQWPDLKEIIEDLGADSPLLQSSYSEASNYYAVGPPYFMHPRDWARVVELWTGLAPRVNHRHPGILAEMYAFCLAAGHLGLRHAIANGYMVSDTRVPEREGWTPVDHLGSQVCDAGTMSRFQGWLPPLLHYCQLYRIGLYYFGKRAISHYSYFSCYASAFELPPPNLLDTPLGKVKVHPKPHKPTHIEVLDRMQAVRQGFMVCTMLRVMNEAQEAYRDRFCRGKLPPDKLLANGSWPVKHFTDFQPAQLAEDLTRPLATAEYLAPPASWR